MQPNPRLLGHLFARKVPKLPIRRLRRRLGQLRSGSFDRHTSHPGDQHAADDDQAQSRGFGGISTWWIVNPFRTSCYEVEGRHTDNIA